MKEKRDIELREEIADKIFIWSRSDLFIPVEVLAGELLAIFNNAPSGLMETKSCNCNQGRIEKGATAPYSAPCPTCGGAGTLSRPLTVKEALEFARNAAANMTFTNEHGESVEVEE